MPRTISQSKLIAAEGKATKLLTEHYLRHLGVQGIQVEDFGGHPSFSAQVRAVRALSGFERNVQSFAIVRDAEDDAAAAFQSVCDALAAANLPIPNALGAKAAGHPDVSVFVLPNNEEGGMLETLCVRSVASDPAAKCVEDYIQCIAAAGLPGPNNIWKARAQAFLASRPVAGLAVGWAAGEEYGYWNWEDESFSQFREFLSAL